MKKIKYFGIKVGTLLIQERNGKEIVTEIVPKTWCEKSCYFDDSEIVETIIYDPLIKIRHSYSPENYFTYFHKNNVVPLY